MSEHAVEIVRYPLECADDLPQPNALIALHRTTERSNPRERYHADLQRDKRGVSFALTEMFGHLSAPLERLAEEVHWRRDALGKPFVVFEGAVAEWAEGVGIEAQHLHVSNTHDGNRQLLLAVYAPHVVGIGVDIVHLPRLSRLSQDRTEKALVQPYLETEELESLRLRIAAHFSLMESASKACGTGLKVGLGMGKPSSLPMQSLGARRLSPITELLIEGQALERLEALGANRTFGAWEAQGDYLTSVVLLIRK
ncbi:MAG: 4'-phosphopantetheinyl transferase superfamily protein [Armatimonadetes bacterium]|nr:4'-phosphopantetheinyl transferase superfamily protein [Armatimonadota bacterium]